MSTFKWEPHFQDTGCEHSPRCQTCPLPRCKHDMTRTEVTRLTFDLKRARVRSTPIGASEGATPDCPTTRVVALAAAETGVTDRTVYRALAATRTAAQPGSA